MSEARLAVAGLALMAWLAIPGVAAPADEGNDAGRMVPIAGGTFEMGTPAAFAGPHDAWEHPQHRVTLAPYWIGKVEVTQGEWLAVMGTNPSFFNGKPKDVDFGTDPRRPVERVDFYDILVYCNRRSLAEGLTPCYSVKGTKDPQRWGAVPAAADAAWNAVICDWEADGYRLPTEAEWLFAATAGKPGAGLSYAGSNDLEAVGWVGSNSNGQTHAVGGKAPNALGLHDMTGNVWEWTWDVMAMFRPEPQANPHGPDGSAADPGHRVDKGGGFRSDPYSARTAFRGECQTTEKAFGLGFRVVRRR